MMTLMEFIYDRKYPVRVSADGGSTHFAPGLVEEIFEAYEKYKSQKSAIPNVSLSWLDSDLQKMAQKTREAYRDFEGDKETVAAQAFINGCYAAKRYFEKQLSHEG